MQSKTSKVLTLQAEKTSRRDYLKLPTLVNAYCNYKDDFYPFLSTGMKPQKDASSQVSVASHDNSHASYSALPPELTKALSQAFVVRSSEKCRDTEYVRGDRKMKS